MKKMIVQIEDEFGELIEVEELDSSNDRLGGFGSTGQ